MANEHVIDATDADFEEAVIRRSETVPVVVDFWAPWCGPCRILGPLLEKLAEEYAGAFVLAKVNTDENPMLAQAFQIQSIPSVHLLVGGKIADGFQGALPESQIRELLAKHVKALPDGDKEGAAGEDDEARVTTLLEAGQVAEAAALLAPLLEKEPESGRLHLLEARVALAGGNAEEAASALDRIPEEDESAHREGERLRGALVFHAACGNGEAAARARIEADADDVEARYALGCCLATSRRYEEALAALLDAVKQDRTWQEGAARKAMVAIFGLLPSGSDLASEYRKQLVIYM